MAEALDSEMLDAMEWVGSRIVIRRGSVLFPGETQYRDLWYVDGAGLGGASGSTLRDALIDWLEGLVTCAEYDPGYFGKYKSMPTFGSDHE